MKRTTSLSKVTSVTTKKADIEEAKSLIDEEVSLYEEKIKDFQEFIREKATVSNIKIQKDLMKELPALLKHLAVLRSLKISTQIDTRGDIELSELETGEI